MRIMCLLVAIMFEVSSCAAMFHGTKETIYVRSDEQHTRFFLNGRDIGKGTSASVTIPKKKLGSAMLRASKKGCSEKTTHIETGFDGITLLGLFWDLGIFSILLVDWLATGAVTKAAQSDYILTPECTQPPVS